MIRTSKQGPNATRIAGPLTAVWLGLLLCSCASIRVSSDYDHSAVFTRYHAFAWMPRQHHGSSNPLTAQRAQDAIEAELTRRGFVRTDDAAAADFIVDFTIGASDRLDVQSYPEPYHGPYWTYPGWWRPYWGSTLDVRTYREGTLSIDVFDAHSHRPVWHGWARKELTRADTENAGNRIRTAVRMVLSSFPPRSER